MQDVLRADFRHHCEWRATCLQVSSCQDDAKCEEGVSACKHAEFDVLVYTYTNTLQHTLVGQYIIAFQDPLVIYNLGRDTQAILAVCCTPFMLIEGPLAQSLVDRRVCATHCKSRALSVRRATWM